MTYHIDIQHAAENTHPVSDEDLRTWATLTLAEHQETGEVTIRLVDKEEIKELNNTFRNQNKPTNVLAFPADLPSGIELELPFLGDVIICPAILKEECEEQSKPLQAHWAHIVIHGVLHLLGYDHIREEDAQKMQPVEIDLLDRFGFDNPYEEDSRE